MAPRGVYGKLRSVALLWLPGFGDFSRRPAVTAPQERYRVPRTSSKKLRLQNGMTWVPGRAKRTGNYHQHCLGDVYVPGRNEVY